MDSRMDGCCHVDGGPGFAKLQVADLSEAIVRTREAGLGERG